MWLHDRVVDGAALAGGVEKPAPLHEAEVFAGHVAGDPAGLGEFAHGVAATKQHFDDPQAVGMGKRSQTLRGLAEGVEADELLFAPALGGAAVGRCVGGGGGHKTAPCGCREVGLLTGRQRTLVTNISTYGDMSIQLFGRERADCRACMVRRGLPPADAPRLRTAYAPLVLGSRLEVPKSQRAGDGPR